MKFTKYILPPFIYNFLLFLKNLFIFSVSSRDETLNKNNFLKTKKNNKRAFLIATGPSLKLENLNLLKNEDCFTLSNAFLLKEINIIKPILHFFAPYHEPITKKSFIKWLNKCDKQLPIKTDIVMNYDDRELINKNLFKKRNIFFLKISDKINLFHINLVKPIPKFQTGSLMVLPVLMNMGYKKIYLLGCDHNQLKNFNSTIENFYDEKNDPRKTKKNKLNSHFLKLDKELRASLNVYEQYKKYGKIAQKLNIEIINLSKNSWLDLFKKDLLKNVIK